MNIEHYFSTQMENIMDVLEFEEKMYELRIWIFIEGILHMVLGAKLHMYNQSHMTTQSLHFIS